MARPFDADRLEFTGEAAPLAEKVLVSRASFNASDEGTLIYETAGPPAASNPMLWMDRAGKTSRGGGAIPVPQISLSPDGKNVAFTESRDLWVYNLDREVRTRLTTSDGISVNHASVWSPDGSRLVFDSSRGKERERRHSLYETRANGATPERLLLEAESGTTLATRDWSRDGRLILFSKGRQGQGGTELWVLPLSGDRKPFLYLAGPFNKPEASFSPNGRWVAYTSNESGSYQVVVQSFPDPAGDKRQISTTGGRHPRWRGDGKEIYYVNPGKQIVAVGVSADEHLSVGKSASLFEAPLLLDPGYGGPNYPYDVTSDGQRFLIPALPERAFGPTTVVLNWAADPRLKAPRP